MRVAVTGASGLLGRHLMTSLTKAGHTVVAATHVTSLPVATPVESHPLDLLDHDSLARFVDAASADWIIHGAALADVDRCEREPEFAYAVNADATIALLDHVARTSARMLYISTDYVFDGQAGPYDEAASTNPINVYGMSKLRGEEAVLNAEHHVTVRSSSFLGVGLPGKPTFAERIIEHLQHAPPVRAPVDQYSNVTPVEYLARGIVALLHPDARGIYHLVGCEIISRSDLTTRLAALLGLPSNAVQGVPYASLTRDASRPLNGGLISTRDTLPPPPLDEALRRFVEEWKRRQP